MSTDISKKCLLKILIPAVSDSFWKQKLCQVTQNTCLVWKNKWLYYCQHTQPTKKMGHC